MNTTENNKLIAEFMGWRERKDPTERWLGQWEDINGQLQRVLHFNSDWNYLMSVVEKIELSNNNAVLIDCYSENNFKYCTEIYSSINFEIEKQRKRITSQQSNESLIITVYKACTEFIKWYNKEQANRAIQDSINLDECSK